MPMTVLIADGDEGLMSLMKASLTKEGFKVLTVTTGHGAITLARQENPDLILLELVLPDMDGYEFMRRRYEEEQTPIIMLAAAAGTDDRVRCLELGADDFVTKPFSPRELTLRARAVLRRAGRTSSQVDASPSIEKAQRKIFNFALA